MLLLVYQNMLDLIKTTIMTIVCVKSTWRCFFFFFFFFLWKIVAESKFDHLPERSLSSICHPNVVQLTCQQLGIMYQADHCIDQ